MIFASRTNDTLGGTPQLLTQVCFPADPLERNSAYCVFSMRLAVSLILVFTGYPIVTSAVEVPDNAQPISVGEGEVYLAGNLELTRTDNKFRTKTDPTNDLGVIVSPNIVYRANLGSMSVETAYEGEYGDFDESDSNYDDHRISVSANAIFSSKFRSDILFSTDQRHVDIGESETVGVVSDTTPVIVRDNRVSASARYGARNARGNLYGRVTVFDHSVPDFNMLSTDVAPDYFLVEPSIELSLRVSSDTRFIVGTRHGIYNYNDNQSDRSITSLLLGLEFSPTGKLRGSFKIGAARSDFDSSLKASSTDFVLDSTIIYEASSLSTIRFNLDRRLDNQDGNDVNFADGGVISDRAAASWNYKWNSRFSTRAFARVKRISKDCPEASTATTTFGINFGLQVSQRFTLGANFSQESRSGDICSTSSDEADSLDYSRRNFGLSLGIVL